MEGFGVKASSVVLALMAIVFTSFITIGEAQMADAPAPSPTSSAAAFSPSFAALFVSAAALLIASVRR